jgi:polar amino acid transport system substrate-binding protein
MLASGEIDAYATNKAALFELSDQLPGSRVLDGRWGQETFAAAVPKGREQGADFLRSFFVAAGSEGLIKGAAERAKMRGIAP